MKGAGYEDEEVETGHAQVEMIVPWDKGTTDATTGRRICGIPDRTIGALLVPRSSWTAATVDMGQEEEMTPHWSFIQSGRPAGWTVARYNLPRQMSTRASSKTRVRSPSTAKTDNAGAEGSAASLWRTTSSWRRAGHRRNR